MIPPPQKSGIRARDLPGLRPAARMFKHLKDTVTYDEPREAIVAFLFENPRRLQCVFDASIKVEPSQHLVDTGSQQTVKA